MTANKMKEVKNLLNRFLGDSIPDEYRGYIVQNILSDVCEDTDASADEEFSDGDVKLALGRVLMSRLGIDA